MICGYCRVFGCTCTPAYDSTSGSPVDRTSTITCTVSAGILNSGTSSNLVDGDRTQNATGSITLVGSHSVTSSDTIEFDFLGVPTKITEVTWERADANNYGVWKWQGWNGSSYVDNGSGNVTLSGTSQVDTTLSGNTTGYTKYRLIGVSGTTAAANWHAEVYFKRCNC